MDEAILWMEETGETLRRVALPRQPYGRFVYELPSVRRDFRYCFRAGDGQTPWHQVRAVQRPRIMEISIKITPPAYTKLPLVEQDTLPRQISAIVGKYLHTFVHL